MSTRLRLRLGIPLAAAAAALLGIATPAGACAGLVTPGGSVRLERTATLAAYADGVEHYVTSFKFSGGGAEFGSILPLPAIPSKVEKGGEWTLQRLDREVRPPTPQPATAEGASAPGSARVVYETRIDALDITVLEGGATAVGTWAREHGFRLTPDAPEVLRYYAARSRIFMAARFDAQAARDRGQEVGDGTPIHLTIPTRNPWVPLRILSLGVPATDQIRADVFLLTTRRPALLPLGRPGVILERSAAASRSLLDDLRSDKGMGWMPAAMWLSYLSIDARADSLRYDLAVDASGRNRPSRLWAGLARLPRPTPSARPTPLPRPTRLAAAPQPASTPYADGFNAPAPVLAVAPAAVRRAIPHGGRSAGPALVALAVIATTGSGLVAWRRRWRDNAA